MTTPRTSNLAQLQPLSRDMRALLNSADWFSPGSLRVLQLSWAPIHARGSVGSGLNLVASHLASHFRKTGARVAAIASGRQYRAFTGPHLRADRVWNGCACVDLVNSTNLATGDVNFRNVQGQQRAPVDERLVVDFARAAGVQVAHVHSFEGLSFGIVRALHAAKIPVVYTPHNYYALCPQIDLNRDERRVCDDFEGGNACVKCLAAPDPSSERRYRARVQGVDAAFGPDAYAALSRMARRAPRSFRDWMTGGPVHRISMEEDAASGGAAEVPTPDAATPRFMKEAQAHDPSRVERLLRGEHHLRVLNAYGQRRVAAVEALNGAHSILCPSAFLLDTHAAMGVSRERLVHVPLGLPHLDHLRQMSALAPGHDQVPWRPSDIRPLRLCFLGTVHPNKGLLTLLRAIMTLTQAERDRIHLLVHATGGDAPVREWFKDVPQVAFLGPYDQARLASLAREYDVAVFPNAGLDNSPLVLLEHLSLGKFTLASDLGGPTGFITHAVNGLRVPASNPAAWAAAIGSILRGDVALPSADAVRAASPLRCFDAFAHDVLVYLRRAAQSAS